VEDAKHQGEFELWWRQTGPETWVVTVLDRETGSRKEARSLEELEAVLLRLPSLPDEAASRVG
jgi:hypothetical protein